VRSSNEILAPPLGFDPAADFAPVAAILRLAMVLSAGAGSQYRSASDLLDAARARLNAALLRRPGDVAAGDREFGLRTR
jgi:tripartite-type tricarboxylate transporter receptor subunit TctC